MLRILRTDKQTLMQLISLAVPMVISQGAFAVMIFTDRFFMSLLSPTHMSASLGGGVAAFFCLSLFMGFLSYGNAMVAQYLGAGRKDKCSRVLSQSIILTLASMPFLLIMGLAVAQLFSLMGHEETQLELETSYFYILLYGAIISLAKLSLSSYFAGIGRTKVVMVADMLAMIINVPITYLIVFGEYGFPQWGIEGAAIGTIISSFFSLLVYLYFYFEPVHAKEFSISKSYVIDKGIISRYVRLGLPSGLERFLNIAAFNLFILMFQSYGVVQGASAAIVLNWDILSFVPMLGIHIAIISSVGRFVGAGSMEKVNSVISAGFILGLGYSGILGILFIVFREPLVEVFITSAVDQPEIHALASWMMIGLASYVMADAVILIASGALRGAGDTHWLMVTSISLHWAMAIAQYLVIEVFNYGPKVSWIIFVSLLLALALAFFARLMGSTWRRPEAISRMMAEST